MSDIYIQIDGSFGQYIYGDCPTCKARGGAEECKHTVLICRNCGAPPTAKGCICDAGHKWQQN